MKFDGLLHGSCLSQARPVLIFSPELDERDTEEVAAGATYVDQLSYSAFKLKETGNSDRDKRYITALKHKRIAKFSDSAQLSS